jgi:Rrf2 family protein
MLISQKCQYALRAIFDLALRYEQGPVRIADIAKAQAIPPRFLEVILSQLKQAGFVASQRGNVGGYYLVRAPQDLTVGDVIRFVQGPIAPVDCVPAVSGGKERCALHGDCVFVTLWDRVQKAMSGVYDTTTFQDLVEQEKERKREYIPSYTI